MKTIAVMSSRPVGCTFIDWSIHWLSGANRYYNFQQHQALDLAANPLSTANAHGHAKNHPRGPDEVADILKSISILPQKNSVYSFYPIAHETPHWCDQLGLDITALTAKDWRRINASQTQELQGIVRRCRDTGTHIIHVDETPSAASYFITPRALPGWVTENFAVQSNETAMFEILFGKHHGKQRRWDLREQLALDMRPLDPCPHGNYIDRKAPHFRLTTTDLWFDGENAMLEIMRWLELPIDAQRHDSWRAVYYAWQQRQMRYARLTWKLVDIVDAIAHDHYLVLGNLTLLQEAAIQHCLIYAHNLNVETWGLERFPANAQDLHKILETNTHQVDTAYRDVLRTSIDSLRSSM